MQNFATKTGMFAPAPGPVLAPDMAPDMAPSATLTSIPFLQFLAEEYEQETPTPAPAPTPEMAPEVPISCLIPHIGSLVSMAVLVHPETSEAE